MIFILDVFFHSGIFTSFFAFVQSKTFIVYLLFRGEKSLNHLKRFKCFYTSITFYFDRANFSQFEKIIGL